MTETKMHKFLKDVGMAFIYNQNCFLVATEVNVSFARQRIDSKLDNHWYIDVCGVGEKYIPYSLRAERKPLWESNNYKYNILRGLEVKVSRNDFKNGFVCSGCNYNYLMIPEGLVYTHEVPKNVGVVKVDVKNFRATFDAISKFNLEGVRVTRKPKFQRVEQWQLDKAIAHIGRRSTRELMLKVAEKLSARLAV